MLRRVPVTRERLVSPDTHGPRHQASDDLPEMMPEDIPDTMPDGIPEHMPKIECQNGCTVISCACRMQKDTTANAVCKIRVLKDMPNRILERMSEVAPVRMPVRILKICETECRKGC